MKKILKIISSPRGESSVSIKLADAIVDKLLTANAGSSVLIHDLINNPFPHLEEAHLTAFFTPAEKRSTESKEAVRHSDEAIEELMDADIIVIGVPMYNFGITSTLKAWIDHICRAGITFQYSANGPEGLVKGKKAYLAIASGGVYSDGFMKSYDFAEPYLRSVLGFIGITDITVVRAEGLSMPDTQATALQKGIDSIKV